MVLWCYAIWYVVNVVPFCVSSFAALVKGADYILVFPPSLRENFIGGGFIALFLTAVAILRAVHTKPAVGGVEQMRP